MSIATNEQKPLNGEATAEHGAQQEQSGQLADQKQHAAPVVYVDESEYSSLLDTAKFWQLQRVAKLFAASTIVPEQFQNSLPNCFIGLQMALRMNVDPFMFLQSCYIVHGRPGIEAKMAIALANASGKFKGSIRYKMERDPKTQRPIACTASAILKETGEEISFRLGWETVEAEGWNKDKENRKTGYVQRSKWNTMPDLMFPYRSAMFLLRTHCPEIIMGMQSKEELEDAFSDEAPQPQSPRLPSANLEELGRRLEADIERAKEQRPKQESSQDGEESADQQQVNEPSSPTGQAESSTPEAEWPELPRLVGTLAECNGEARVKSVCETWVKNYPDFKAAIEAECQNRMAQIGGAKQQGELIK